MNLLNKLKSAPRGLLITFEGLDKSGKSTQVGLLSKCLDAAGILNSTFKFPDRTTESGKIIDQFLCKKIDLEPEKAHRLFSQNRWEKSDAVLQLLKARNTVILDRYAYSGLAYSLAKGVSRKEALRKEDEGLPEPDIVFYLRIDPNKAKLRDGYGDEVFETLGFQKIVQRHFEEMMDKNFVTVDSDLSKEKISRIVMETVDGFEWQGKERKLRKLWTDGYFNLI
jgi:dTMP kinase